MKNEIIEVGGSKWKVREARALNDAMHAIDLAACTGSVGSEFCENGVVVADVVRLNDDGTERKAAA
jgi:hypothetical protein